MSLSQLLTAAIIVSVLTVGIFVAVVLMFGHALIPVREDVSASQIVDRNEIPPGSYVKFSGVPKAAVAMKTSTRTEGLSAFQHQPRLVLYSQHPDPYNREILASDLDDENCEFFQKVWEVEGRLDIPGNAEPPREKLEQFVTRNLGFKSVDDVRILYVGIDPAVDQSNFLVGLLCGGVFGFIALISWIGVIAGALNRKRGDLAKPSAGE
jgi:hypothetical protein